MTTQYAGYYPDIRNGNKYAFGELLPGGDERGEGVLLHEMALAMFPDWMEPVEVLGVSGPGYVWWDDPREAFWLSEFERYFRPVTGVAIPSNVACPRHSDRTLYLVYSPGESWIGCA